MRHSHNPAPQRKHIVPPPSPPTPATHTHATQLHPPNTEQHPRGSSRLPPPKRPSPRALSLASSAGPPAHRAAQGAVATHFHAAGAPAVDGRCRRRWRPLLPPALVLAPSVICATCTSKAAAVAGAAGAAGAVLPEERVSPRPPVALRVGGGCPGGACAGCGLKAQAGTRVSKHARTRALLQVGGTCRSVSAACEPGLGPRACLQVPACPARPRALQLL